MSYTICLLLVSWFCSFALQGQNYLPVIEQEKSYLQRVSVCDVGGGYLLEIRGDTLINELNYAQLYKVSCTEGPQFYGHLRSNATNSKLWFTPKDAAEVLVMDLDLILGDSFLFYNSYLPDLKLVVTAIDTSLGRKQIHFSIESFNCLLGPNAQSFLTFIEGIGPTQGFDDATFYSFLLDCVKQDTTVLYKNEDLFWTNCNQSCLDLTTHVESFTRPEKSPLYTLVFRFGNEIQIEVRENNLPYFLWDINGRLITNGSLSKGIQTLPFTVNNRGVYFFSVYSRRLRQVQTEKIILQD